MNTNTSIRGAIRFRRYQCRSHAGGRPPCQDVKLKAWDIEEFMAEQIGKWEDSPELAKVFRDEWPALVTEKRQELLNEFVARIVYNNDDDGQVEIDMNREAVARFVSEKVDDASCEEES